MVDETAEVCSCGVRLSLSRGVANSKYALIAPHVNCTKSALICLASYPHYGSTEETGRIYTRYRRLLEECESQNTRHCGRQVHAISWVPQNIYSSITNYVLKVYTAEVHLGRVYIQTCCNIPQRKSQAKCSTVLSKQRKYKTYVSSEVWQRQQMTLLILTLTLINYQVTHYQMFALLGYYSVFYKLTYDTVHAKAVKIKKSLISTLP